MVSLKLKLVCVDPRCPNKGFRVKVAAVKAGHVLL